MLHVYAFWASSKKQCGHFRGAYRALLKIVVPFKHRNKMEKAPPREGRGQDHQLRFGGLAGQLLMSVS
jgi:hypothetical protein